MTYAQPRHVWSTGCTVCDDALNSGQVRCSCDWNADGEPPVSHRSVCPAARFEGTHPRQAAQPQGTQH